MFYFLMKDKKLLAKYNEVWKKVSRIIKHEFDSKPVYNEKYQNTKKKQPYNRKRTQIFTIIKYQKKVLNIFVYQ